MRNTSDEPCICHHRVVYCSIGSQRVRGCVCKPSWLTTCISWQRFCGQCRHLSLHSAPWLPGQSLCHERVHRCRGLQNAKNAGLCRQLLEFGSGEHPCRGSKLCRKRCTEPIRSSRRRRSEVASCDPSVPACRILGCVPPRPERLASCSSFRLHSGLQEPGKVNFVQSPRRRRSFIFQTSTEPRPDGPDVALRNQPRVNTPAALQPFNRTQAISTCASTDSRGRLGPSWKKYVT